MWISCVLKNEIEEDSLIELRADWGQVEVYH